MSKKSKKVEKETRRLMEAIGELVKKKNDSYKFKSKDKKKVKKVKKKCVHWTIRKGKEIPTVKHDPEHPGCWKCLICGAVFPIKPIESNGEKNAYEESVDHVVGLVNQMQFLSVKLGGDADDTKMFLRLREDLPRFAKVSKQILKRVNKREEYENNSKKGDVMSQFDAYNGFNYR